jgi:hypothetical protein
MVRARLTVKNDEARLQGRNAERQKLCGEESSTFRERNMETRPGINSRRSEDLSNIVLPQAPLTGDLGGPNIVLPQAPLTGNLGGPNLCRVLLPSRRRVNS